MSSKTKVAKSILTHKPARPDSNVYVVCYKGEAKESIQAISENNPSIFADLTNEEDATIIDGIIQVASEWNNLLNSGLSDQDDMTLSVHVNNATASFVKELKKNTPYNVCLIAPEVFNGSVQNIKDEIRKKLSIYVF